MHDPESDSKLMVLERHLEGEPRLLVLLIVPTIHVNLVFIKVQTVNRVQAQSSIEVARVVAFFPHGWRVGTIGRLCGNYTRVWK